MEKIEISKNENNITWEVKKGNKVAEVSWDEMLGLVASLTMPENRPCLHWMKTEEEHRAHRAIAEVLSDNTESIHE